MRALIAEVLNREPGAGLKIVVDKQIGRFKQTKKVSSKMHRFRFKPRIRSFALHLYTI